MEIRLGQIKMKMNEKILEHEMEIRLEQLKMKMNEKNIGTMIDDTVGMVDEWKI